MTATPGVHSELDDWSAGREKKALPRFERRSEISPPTLVGREVDANRA